MEAVRYRAWLDEAKAQYSPDILLYLYHLWEQKGLEKNHASRGIYDWIQERRKTRELIANPYFEILYFSFQKIIVLRQEREQLIQLKIEEDRYVEKNQGRQLRDDIKKDIETSHLEKQWEFMKAFGKYALGYTTENLLEENFKSMHFFIDMTYSALEGLSKLYHSEHEFFEKLLKKHLENKENAFLSPEIDRTLTIEIRRLDFLSNQWLKKFIDLFMSEKHVLPCTYRNPLIEIDYLQDTYDWVAEGYLSSDIIHPGSGPSELVSYLKDRQKIPLEKLTPQNVGDALSSIKKRTCRYHEIIQELEVYWNYSYQEEFIFYMHFDGFDGDGTSFFEAFGLDPEYLKTHSHLFAWNIKIILLNKGVDFEKLEKLHQLVAIEGPVSNGFSDLISQKLNDPLLDPTLIPVGLSILDREFHKERDLLQRQVSDFSELEQEKMDLSKKSLPWGGVEILRLMPRDDRTLETEREKFNRRLFPFLPEKNPLDLFPTPQTGFRVTPVLSPKQTQFNFNSRKKALYSHLADRGRIFEGIYSLYKNHPHLSLEKKMNIYKSILISDQNGNHQNLFASYYEELHLLEKWKQEVIQVHQDCLSRGTEELSGELLKFILDRSILIGQYFEEAKSKVKKQWIEKEEDVWTVASGSAPSNEVKEDIRTMIDLLSP
ncbi:MAG: hypothetical protein HYS98_08545 [Deltaproteobacteria bacterium]|nr:hypothetical protein [Deltaproteobacteria bacterium]